MVRTKEFDRARALDAAVRVFWKRGYGGTSVQALVDAMGLHRAHLYDAFGSKEDLFAEVVARYSDMVLRELFAPLGGTGDFPPGEPVLPRLVQVLDGVARSCSDPSRPGCLVDSALLSHASELGRAREVCLDHLSRVEAKLGEAVRVGQRVGDLREDVPTEELVAIVRGALVGMICAVVVKQDSGDASAIRDGMVRALTP